MLHSKHGSPTSDLTSVRRVEQLGIKNSQNLSLLQYISYVLLYLLNPGSVRNVNRFDEQYLKRLEPLH